jgi:hypothetical protein
VGARHGLRALYGIHRDDIRHPKMRLPRSTHSKMSLFAAMAALMCAVIPALSADNKSNVKQTDPLPSWNDGPAEQAIVDFVRVATE